ncbi:hypothetical protein ERJ75_000190100 [Trypanosoma vivax]|nr:hypothetical protein ERJ75_000190100 [Trypanosoma vivax]
MQVKFSEHERPLGGDVDEAAGRHTENSRSARSYVKERQQRRTAQQQYAHMPRRGYFAKGGELDKQIARAQQVVDKHVQDAKDLAREGSEEGTAPPQNAPTHKNTQENKRGTEQARTALEHATSKGQSTHNADNAPTIELTGTAAAALLCMTLAAGAQRH